MMSGISMGVTGSAGVGSKCAGSTGGGEGSGCACSASGGGFGCACSGVIGEPCTSNIVQGCEGIFVFQ